MPKMIEVAHKLKKTQSLVLRTSNCQRGLYFDFEYTDAISEGETKKQQTFSKLSLKKMCLADCGWSGPNDRWHSIKGPTKMEAIRKRCIFSYPSISIPTLVIHS